MKKLIFNIIISSVLLSVLSACNSSHVNNLAKPENKIEYAVQIAEKELEKQKELEEAKAKEMAFRQKCRDNSGITIIELNRNANKYKDKPIWLSGTILQVIESNDPDNISMIMTIDALAEEDSSYDLNNVYIDFKKPSGTGRILEGDIIQVYGTVKGLKTYESVQNTNITIPRIKASYVDGEYNGYGLSTDIDVDELNKAYAELVGCYVSQNDEILNIPQDEAKFIDDALCFPGYVDKASCDCIFNLFNFQEYDDVKLMYVYVTNYNYYNEYFRLYLFPDNNLVLCNLELYSSDNGLYEVEANYIYYEKTDSNIKLNAKTDGEVYVATDFVGKSVKDLQSLFSDDYELIDNYSEVETGYIRFSKFPYLFEVNINDGNVVNDTPVISIIILKGGKLTKDIEVEMSYDDLSKKIRHYVIPEDDEFNEFLKYCTFNLDDKYGIMAYSYDVNDPNLIRYIVVTDKFNEETFMIGDTGGTLFLPDDRNSIVKFIGKPVYEVMDEYGYDYIMPDEGISGGRYIYYEGLPYKFIFGVEDWKNPTFEENLNWIFVYEGGVISDDLYVGMTFDDIAKIYDDIDVNVVEESVMYTPGVWYGNIKIFGKDIDFIAETKTGPTIFAFIS